MYLSVLGIDGRKTLAYSLRPNPRNNRLPVTMNRLNKQGDVENFEIYDFPGQFTYGAYDEGEALVRLRVEALEPRAKVSAARATAGR